LDDVVQKALRDVVTGCVFSDKFAHLKRLTRVQPNVGARALEFGCKFWGPNRNPTTASDGKCKGEAYQAIQHQWGIPNEIMKKLPDLYVKW
jgi:hypothetical protein